MHPKWVRLVLLWLVGACQYNIILILNLCRSYYIVTDHYLLADEQYTQTITLQLLLPQKEEIRSLHPPLHRTRTLYLRLKTRARLQLSGTTRPETLRTQNSPQNTQVRR